MRVGVFGATGAVGKELVQVLGDRGYPVTELRLFASQRSAGTRIPTPFGDKIVEVYDPASPPRLDLALLAVSGEWSKAHARELVAAGAVVVDNSSAFRLEDDVPLVVPEVNPEAIAGYTKRHIIANPNCSTIQMVVALKPLHDLAKIKRVVVATYQSVSGAGRDAMDELFNQTRAVYVNDPIEKKKFAKQIAFNVIPQIDVFMDDGSTKEEWKMVVETKKILDPNILVTATCVRVPVFISHSESVNIEFERPISADEAREALRAAPGVNVIDHLAEEGFVTPVETAGDDPVFVSRIREDISVENGLNMWVVADNLRKGAALNAVQIAEVLARDYLKK